jgi:hypothetical protein
MQILCDRCIRALRSRGEMQREREIEQKHSQPEREKSRGIEIE